MAELATAESVDRYGPFAVAAVTMTLVAFPIAFNLGAYDAVFYEDVFRFVVAAPAGPAVSFITPVQRGRRLWILRCTLAAPALWFVLSVLFYDSTAEAARDPLFGTLAAVVAVISLPAVLKLLIDLFVPGITTLENARLVLAAVAIVVITAVVGFMVGAHNDVLLTCDDFEVAGSDLPPNCAPG